MALSRTSINFESTKKAAAQKQSLRTGRYYTFAASAVASSATTLNRLRVGPCFFDEAFPADRVGFQCSVAAASSSVRLTIYSDLGGYPDALLLDSGAITSTAAGFLEATVAFTFAANTRYWMGGVAQGGTPTVASFTGVAPGVGLTSAEVHSNVGTGVGYFLDSISGAPPATFTAGGAGSGNVPQVWLRKA